MLRLRCLRFSLGHPPGGSAVARVVTPAPAAAPARPGLTSLAWLAAALALAWVSPVEALEACPAGMKLVAGGRFTLADGSEVAEIDPLCLDETEVTAGDYATCVARGACPEAGLRCGKTATYGAKTRQAHPVNCVAWTDADAFCRAHGKRLPSEAEWEWAARGRLRALTYPWGNSPPADQACWDGPGNALGKGGRNDTCPVAAHPRSDSPDGFHDLAGNVREWTATAIGRDRVVRGGSWGDSLPDFLAAGFRGMNKPDERFEITGFRCAAAPGAATVALPRVAVPPVPAADLVPAASRDAAALAAPALPAPRQAPSAVRPAAASPRLPAAEPPPERLAPPPAAATSPRAAEVSEEELEEEGVVIAPAGYQPPPRVVPPPPVAAPAPPARPAADAASSKEATKAGRGSKPPPRELIEFGEIKIQSLSGAELR